jgi:hypothetical protein
VANIFKNPGKKSLKSLLFKIGIETLEQGGWTVSRIRGAGKSSVRRITKNGTSHVASIRTSQDTWIAFPRKVDDSGWGTLDDVDKVIPVSVDDAYDPKFALVHMVDAKEMRDRFNRSYAARKATGRKVSKGHGMWLPLYIPNEKSPPAHVGGGAGLDNPPIAKVPLVEPQVGAKVSPNKSVYEDRTGIIAEAKHLLAVKLGVNPSSIKIMIEA